MSGILIPGQREPSEPEKGGKIEVAGGSGQARRDKEEEAKRKERAAAAAQAERAAAPSPQPQSGAQRQAPDLAFPPTGAQVQCPNCGTPFTVPVFSIIDLGENPELRMPLLGGQVNVAACPSCGAGGPLSAPLLLHDPEHEFLGVFVPPTGQGDNLQSQRLIGDLTQTLMRKLPTEARRGYMLTAKEFMDWQRFMEVLWGFEGVTPEMLRRQRDQSELLQRLAGLANDPKALEIAVSRDAALVDSDFFAMLDRILMMAGDNEQVQPLLNLRNYLLENTDAGTLVKAREAKIRGLLETISAETSREEFLDLMVKAWGEEDGEEVAATLSMAAAPLVDYQFLTLLAARIEQTADQEEQESLTNLRDLLVQVQQEMQAQQQQQSAANSGQQAQSLLQELLQANDTAARLQELAAYVDESFLALLAGQIRTAEQNNATAAARRLRQVYEQALNILQQSLPADLRFLNELLGAPDSNAARAMLRENREMVTKEFLDAVTGLEGEMRTNGRTELADRLKSLRGQIALML